MRRLVIETATAALSLALYEDGALIASFDEVIGRGHAERLIPEIAKLPDGGRAQQIWVDSGPGSFTGVRIGIAAAKGLAIAWSASVRAFPCHALVAATMMANHAKAGEGDVLIAMEGGHGEWLIAPVTGGVPARQPTAMTPARAVVHDQPVITGSRAEEFVALRGHGTAYPLYPAARHADLIGPDFLGGDTTALYARAPDATPMQSMIR